MTIGGIDINLLVPSDVPIHERIFDQMGQQWPEARFLDAESNCDRSLDDPEARRTAVNSREFFVHRDRASVKSWDAMGADPSNLNTMIHFLVEDVSTAKEGTRQVTIVCDERTPQIDRLIQALEAVVVEVEPARTG